MFSIFPISPDEREEGDAYPYSESPAFAAIHTPSSHDSTPLPSIYIDTARGGTPEERECDYGSTSKRGLIRSRESSRGKEDSKETLARELSLLLQQHSQQQYLRTSAPSSPDNSTPTPPVQALLEELLGSLATGDFDYSDFDMVRPLSGHFATRMTQELESRLTQELEAERALRRDSETRVGQLLRELEQERAHKADAEAKATTLEVRVSSLEETCTNVVAQLKNAKEEARKWYGKHTEDKDFMEVVHSFVNTVDGIHVNTKDDAVVKETVEGLREENAQLEKMYKHAMVELDNLRKGQEGGWNEEVLRKKNKQLAKELELLHQEYDGLLHSKGNEVLAHSKISNHSNIVGGFGTSYDSNSPPATISSSSSEEDGWVEDKKNARRKSKGGSFLKRIMG